MVDIPLIAIPNQSLSVQLDSNLVDDANNTPNLVNFDIKIHSCNNNPETPGTAIMSVTITVNSGVLPVVLVENVRASSSGTLLGYDYLEEYGDFIFTTKNDEYPDYNEFGITQFLTYVSSAEIGLLRDSNDQS